jgi:dienelactone hydrolase
METERSLRACAILILAAMSAPCHPAESPDAANRIKGLKIEGESWACEADGKPLAGILAKPPGKGPFPGILISHGLGGNARQMGLAKGREFAKTGFVCIATDYTHVRPGPDFSQFGASAENIRRATACIEILRGLPGVDPDRIAAYGHSMGAFLTIGLAADEPGLLKAAAITAGGIAPEEGFPAPSAARAEKIRTPFLILHGSSDTTVPPERSASLEAILKKNKVPCERRVWDGIGHGLPNEKAGEVFAATREWFQKNGVLRP